MNSRRVITLCTAALLAATGGLVAATPASAATTYTLTETYRATNMTNFNEPLATCSGTPGFTCAISTTTSATRSVDAAFGLSRAWVTAQLKVSNSTTRSVTVSCSATLSTKYGRLVAYPVGTQIFYKITQTTASGTTTSGTLMTFEPAANSQSCYLYA
jgi:hypothetical protein